MKRTVFLKLTVVWEETYEGLSDEILLEDTGIFEGLKDGVMIKVIPNPYQYRIKFPEDPEVDDVDKKIIEDFDAMLSELPIAKRPAEQPFSDEELQIHKKWLESEEGKKTLRDGQDRAEREINELGLRDIDPEKLREPFNI